jgi:four helix bundle protein
MNEDDLKKRTKQFALKILKLIAIIPSTIEGRVIANQLTKSGTSVGANYRAACKARSRAEFIAKIGVVEEEADECIYWLELVIEAKLSKKELVEPLLKEAGEIVAIMASSRKSATKNRTLERSNPANGWTIGNRK